VTANVLFVRHGENPANLANQLSCRFVDFSLTDRGRRQAEALAAHLAAGHEGRITALFASPLRRAHETAGIIGARLGLETTVLEELRELDCGQLEGRSDEEAWAIHDEIDRAWVSGVAGATFPGGEDLPTLLGRFARGLREIVTRNPDGRSVVVGHAGLMRIGLANLFRDSSIELGGPVGNCSIIELELDADGPELRGRVACWARSEHLAEIA
jgi:probable phosphoglycerate mutase